MKIKYVHVSDPETEKVHDTVVALEKNPMINMTQNQYDAYELGLYERDYRLGYVISYEIIEP